MLIMNWTVGDDRVKMQTCLYTLLSFSGRVLLLARSVFQKSVFVASQWIIQMITVHIVDCRQSLLESFYDVSLVGKYETES